MSVRDMQIENTITLWKLECWALKLNASEDGSMVCTHEDKQNFIRFIQIAREQQGEKIDSDKLPIQNPYK